MSSFTLDFRTLSICQLLLVYLACLSVCLLVRVCVCVCQSDVNNRVRLLDKD